MSAKPVLILQPRRMGDLILTFPLALDLRRLFPGSPVWVAARESFFRPLMPFAPGIVFFPHTHLPVLAQGRYEGVINLGRDEATTTCLAQAESPLKLGPSGAGSFNNVQGFWQLYRESLTQNNRHNIFHWSDLFRMDVAPLPLTSIRRWLRRPGNGRIGLFVGASEAAKRPAPAFWASLSARLSKMGFKPVLLGGPGETTVSKEIMAQGGRAANFCGKTDLAQLAALLKTMDLLITPDTGPMHLADWLNTPLLNLSMGNVQAAETGPSGPGQFILRPRMSCYGCWGCNRGRLVCHIPFKPAVVASLAAALARGDETLPPTPGLEILVTGRDDLGLHTLKGDSQTAHKLLDKFWQNIFLSFYDARTHKERAERATQKLLTTYPRLAEAIRGNLTGILTMLARSKRQEASLPENFWRRQPWHSRIFAGYMQMFLQNEGYTRESRQTALQQLDILQSLLTG